MKRLTLCWGISVSLVLLVACSGDPTGSLRNGVEKLNPSPSQMFLQQGKTGTVTVSATDGQGNQVETAFAIKSTGPGISVDRDPTFRPVFVNDSQLAPPATDAMFRYRVTANDLVGSSFTITAEGKDVVIPVNVTAAPGTIPAATVTSTGTPVNTPTVLSIPAPYQFPVDAFARFDAGDALVVGRAADGSTLTVLAPPGTTSAGNVSVVLGYLPSILDSTATATPVTVDPTAPTLAGTGSPTTAPDIAIPPAGGATGFFDAGTFTGADLTGDTSPTGFAQYYKLTIPADGDYTITTNWNNDADIDQFICNDATCAGATLVGTGSSQPESGTLTLTAGTHYLAVVLFAGGTPPPPSGNPAWVSIQLKH
jgi:hypothetical protein